VTLGTFHHPRYEIIATGDVHDAPDEVIAEFNLLGTHLGSTGRAFMCRMLVIFESASHMTS
jgi:hypothetical protein